ncbi:MAG: T9SS type A sorting domain-containing protein [Bacteroidetes bacterium]|nr:T9SS type A sorting domain-containing protein [Bacteroidota bacterium]
MYLYAANTSVLKVSQAGGLGNEEIVYNPAQNVDATYYVRVRGYNGAYSDINCYTLHVETSASLLRESAEPMTDSKPEFVLFPMPAVDYFTTNVFYEGVKDLVCNVYNAMGQKLYSKKMLTQDGANEIRIETQSMNSGMYLLEVIDSEERRVQKFTVEK